jgi:prepilin-type N-terminal cleavage/methylation domain-containing protein
MKNFTPKNSSKKSLTAILNLIQNLFDEIKQNEAVAKFAKHETLTRISNFRRAQIEILPSHRERGILAQLLINLKKGNLNKKSHDRNILEETQFNEPPSLFVRGKNFLVNDNELRNLGEGKSLSKTQNPPTSFKREEGKKAAFTLAEVLITLGIIGVVAAMTIPTLLSNVTKRQYAIKLRKAVSTLSNAARMSNAQYGYDYSGINSHCTKNSATDTPDKMSLCGMLNGTLTGTTFYWGLNSLPDYDITSTNFYKDTWSFNSFHNNLPIYELSDGTLIIFSGGFGDNSCSFNLERNTATLTSDGYGTACYAMIDVNGTSLPNKETVCSTGTYNRLVRTSGNCVVKQKDIQDIFAVAFYDGSVEPTTSPTWYVWEHYK